MGTEGLIEMVFTLMVFEASIMAAKSTLSEPEPELVKETGTLTINPSDEVEPEPEPFVWTISISASVFEPLYVWSDGAYIRISDGIYCVP